MKISTFMPITNPESNGYPYLEAIYSHLLFSDELIILDGGSNDNSLENIVEKFEKDLDRIKVIKYTWKQGRGNWTWEVFSQVWDLGYQECSGDWVFAGECDHVFPEEEAKKVRGAIERHGKGRKVLLVDKWVTSTWNKFINKSKFAYALNKGEFNNLGYGVDYNTKRGQDLANPIEVKGFDFKYKIKKGRLLTDVDGHNMGVHFLNYDKTFKTREQILKDREAMNWAWNNSVLVKEGLMEGWEEIDVLEDVIKRMKSRKESSTITLTIDEQPAFIRGKLRALNNSQLGYSLFEK